MKKSNGQKFIESTLRKQSKASEAVRLEYEATKDPQVVISYIKSSPAAAGLNEPWTVNVIQEWARNDRYDLLRQAFLPRRGESTQKNYQKILAMMFAHRIDNFRMAGQSLQDAFISELQRNGHGDLTGDELNKSLISLKNKYHRAKRIKTEISIQETADSLILTAFPAKIFCNGAFVFGHWSITFPKK